MIAIVDGFEIELLVDVLYSPGENLILFECEYCDELSLVPIGEHHLNWWTMSDDDGFGFFDIDGKCTCCEHWSNLGTEVNYK